VCGTAFSQTAEKRRFFYLDAGVGLGGVTYYAELDNVLKPVKDRGFDHVTLSLDASVGVAVSKNLYVVGSAV
jgi:hypothetical protein